jgi:hypothetical protein
MKSTSPSQQHFLRFSEFYTLLTAIQTHQTVPVFQGQRTLHFFSFLPLKMASQITPEFFNTQEKQNPADSTQLSVLKRLFSDPSVSVSELARLASIPILKDLQKDSNVPPNPYAFWRPIANAVKVLPEYHDKLVEFMIELQKIQCPGTYNLIDGYRQFWAEEAWSCESSTSPLSCHALLICFVSDDSSISTSSTEQGAWMNLNIFSAKLSATKIPALDELDRGGNTLRDTLENIQSNSSGEDLCARGRDCGRVARR